MTSGEMIFPIGFDLDKAVSEAAKDWDSKYADKLEKAIQKRALEVKLKFSPTNFDSLDDVKKRLSELKLEPITPETKTAIKELAAELRTLAKALEQVQKYSTGKAAVSPDAVRAARISEINQRNADKAAIALENQRAAAARAAAAEERLAIARDKSAQAAARAAKGVRDLTNAYKEQSSYLDRLLQRMVTYWSVQQVRQFLTSVREVTAQFELQRVSLGAIIQDQARANALFSEIKGFALKSPISILDLTKYTKQVAAYRIETDKLFDTTKRIMDVSVGLGVDASRLVLAYGQVKAASYLRAAEIRQFTEAGIPMLELLAEKFTKLNGEMVTTEQVMDMVSKRGVEFSMVEEIFNDMTSAGGMFYNMQEKQGNTLYGLWAKLGDAASVMYDEIGNTSWVDEGMKDGIQMLTLLMKNWKLVSGEMLVVGTAIGIITMKQKAHATAMNLQKAALMKVRSAGIAYNAILKEEAALTADSTVAQRQSVLARKANAKAALDAAIAERTAAASTNVWTRSMDKLKAAFMGNWVTLLITAIAALGVGIYNAVQKANKLKNELNSIDAERLTLTSQSIHNFTYLADTALKAAEGSKAQKNALDELHRTYKDMIPAERLTIENLRKMKEEGYVPLTQAIEEYIAVQSKQKKISAVQEEFGSEIQDKYKKLYNELTEGVNINVGGRNFKQWVELHFSPTDFERAINEFEKRATDKTKSLRQKLKESFAAIGHDLSSSELTALMQVGQWGVFDDGYFVSMNEALEKQAEHLKAIEEGSVAATGALGRFTKAQENVNKAMNNTRYTRGGKALDSDKDSYLLSQMQINANIKAIAKEIQTNTDIIGAMKQAGIGIKAEWFKIIESLNPNDLGNISLIDFDAMIDEVDKAIERLGNTNPLLKNVLNQLKNTLRGWKEEQRKMIPDEAVVRTWRGRWQAIANSMHSSTNFMGKWLMKSGDDFETYRKKIKDEIDRIAKQVQVLQNALQLQLKAELSGSNTRLSDEERKKKEQELAQLKKDQEALQKLYDELAKVDLESPNKKNKGGRAEQDKRFELLKNEFSMVKKLHDEYKKMAEVVGGDKAAAKLNELYGSTLKMLAKRHNITLPTTIDETTASLDILLAKMKSLAGAKGKKGQLLFPNAQKEIEDFAMQVETLRVDEVRKNIEQKLKSLADRISRTKTAKEFYEKILSQTGDVELAATLSIAVYGSNGKELRQQVIDEIQEILGKDKKGQLLEFAAAVRKDKSIDYDELVRIAKGYQDIGEISTETYNRILKMRDEDRKDFAKTIDGWLKATEKAKSYSDKLLDLENKTSTQIAKIETRKRQVQESLGMFDEEVNPEEVKKFQDLISFYDTQIKGLRERQAKGEAKLMYEAFKDTPMYVQIFDDLDHASTRMLDNMKSRLESMRDNWKNLDPTQLKELQSRLNEIDKQLAQRNPFKTLADGFKKLRNLRKSGDGSANDGGKGSKSESEAGQYLIDTAKKADEARASYSAMLKKYAVKDNETLEEWQERMGTEIPKELMNAKAELDEAMSNEEAAQKAVENWKKVKDTIGLSANELFQMLNWAGDIARGIADISEAMGADEEDVQYWNDIASALDQVAGGIQDIVQSAMSGNVVGIISSALTAIPKMFVGFTELFSAGKIRKANKEIERQEELLERLEYTYGRLQKAADKLFGASYIANYNQQLRTLNAQAKAYQKQAEAERSKGKKADEDKIKEYENSARQTFDEIADMQGQLVERMTGTDVASAARDFAQAWLEAYASFGSTTEAIKEKFNDMIKNMIVESVMAQTVQMALQPMFDEMDRMYKSGASMTEVVGYAFEQADRVTEELAAGLGANARYLEKLGVDIKGLYDSGNNLRGISRDIATASEESINGLAVGVNTLSHYASPIPTISENVAAILRIVSKNDFVQPGEVTDVTAYWDRHLELQQGIHRHTAETAEECKKIAAQCAALASDLHKVIVPPGGATASRSIQVKL